MDVKQAANNRGEKNIYLRILSWIPAVIMMGIIFLYSSKPAEVSKGSSTPIAEASLSVYEYFFGTISAPERPNWLDTASFIVRKTAHVTEYMMLSLSISWPLWIRRVRDKKLMWLAFVISVIYAGTDEVHQLFIQGRSGSLRDVGIDAIGCVIGSVLFWIIARQIEKRKRTKKLSVTGTDLQSGYNGNQ